MKPALLRLVVLALVACSDPQAPLWWTSSPGDPIQPPNGPVAVRWTLTEEPGGLRVDYEIENRGVETIVALDRVVSPDGGQVLERPVVSAGADRATVRLIAGSAHPRLRTDRAVAIEFPPEIEARPVAPGTSVSGRRRVPLPLVAWHPDFHSDELRDALEPIDLQAGWAILEVEWRTESGTPRTAHGRRVRIPR